MAHSPRDVALFDADLTTLPAGGVCGNGNNSVRHQRSCEARPLFALGRAMDGLRTRDNIVSLS